MIVKEGRAVGVEVESGGEVQRVYGRRITLSAGAIASPAILLRSGIGPAADLSALGIAPLVDLPGVGANLIDHPLTQVMYVPKPGVQYVNGGTEEFTYPATQAIADLITQAMEKARR